MDFEENTVNDMPEAEDSLPEDLVEDEGESESIDSVLEEDGEEKQEEAAGDKGDEGPREPGYVQGRIQKAVQKAVAETEARFTAQIQAMEAQYAPIRERLLEMDAKELVASGKVKDLETARELVRYRQGMAPAAQEAQPEKQEQPRQPNGQFAPKQDPAIQAKIDMLTHQADTIKAKTGLDVFAEWDANPEIRKKVTSGEWDFYDVAEHMSQQKPARKKPPAPTRSANGASGSEKSSIASMSNEQFDRLEKKISEGARYSV